MFNLFQRASTLFCFAASRYGAAMGLFPHVDEELCMECEVMARKHGRRGMKDLKGEIPEAFYKLDDETLPERI